MKQDIPTIVLLHGWGGTRESLAALANELIKGNYQTLILEMPGHGETQKMDKPWNMKDFATWLKDNLDERSLQNYILVGHSFGGKIILESVIEGILSPVKIFLINISGIKPKNTFKKELFRFLSKVSKPFSTLPFSNSIKKIIYKYVIREQDYANTSGNLKETFKIINEEHYGDKLKKISIPTIIIWGKEDKVTPIWMGRKINNEIPNSKFIEMDGTHGLPLKKPKEVALQIINNI